MPADFAPLGLAIGHATDVDGATGCTVVRGIDAPLRASAAVLGRATGTRELDALNPAHLVDRIDAVLLTGGSAYGLEAAGGVMRWMEEQGRGFSVGPGVVPIVPAAVIFDLAPLGRFEARPTPAMAYAACAAATPSGIAEGSVGAGTGATVGKLLGIERAMKGGVGVWTASAGTLVAGAVAVVNALGDVRDASGRLIAGARTPDDALADAERLLVRGEISRRGFGDQEARGRNTTLCVVATNAALSRIELAQLANAAAAALFRRITPAGTSFDGDVAFALAPYEGGVPAGALQVEALVVDVLGTAVERAVLEARGRDGIPGAVELPASRIR